MTVSALLWSLVGGSVVGLLGKWVGPGDHDEVPLWVTVLGGVSGALAGTALHAVFFTSQPVGTDWWRHAWQLGAAAVVVLALAGLTGRGHSRAGDRRTSPGS